ncbi:MULTISPECIES: hypothetical protein [unclassified Paraburkholderia]|uniref:hypothetical protein n=1 Tax=unclassified Paraburkholderia TaxID=2615204 RepID=UPI002AB0AC7C|nr:MULTISPECIES: hypothetical protein [unclassified Paraburkholderia]
MQIVGEATGPRELFRLLENVPCDVVLTDLTMLGEPDDAEDDLHRVRGLRCDWPQLRIVVLTRIANVAILRAVMNTGGTALIRKSRCSKRIAVI